MIVVDSSALIAFFLREEDWQNLSKYMTLTMSVDHVIKEFYNSLWKAVYLKKVMEIKDIMRVIELFEKYLKGNIIIESEEKYLKSALKIAIQEGLPIYDTIYIAQALHNNKPLLTLDEKQRKIALKYDLKVFP